MLRLLIVRALKTLRTINNIFSIEWLSLRHKFLVNESYNQEVRIKKE